VYYARADNDVEGLICPVDRPASWRHDVAVILVAFGEDELR